VMSVFPSLKCFTHCLTLLVIMQASLYACLSHGNIQCGNFVLNDIVSQHIAATACPILPFSFTEICPCDGGRQCDLHSGVRN
jgi:hypothetical protein